MAAPLPPCGNTFYGTDTLASAPRLFLPSIQFGRALAATMVLYFHCGEALKKSGHDLGISTAGSAGVDIFFVISGFIIYYVSRDESPKTFFLKRLIRIVPAYWFYTSIVIFLLLFLPQLYGTLRFDGSFALLSYLFIISETNAGTPGVALGVGWTLAFEMYFYVLATIALLISRDKWFWVVTVAIVAGAMLSVFISPPPALIPVVSALPLEFLVGVAIARAYFSGFRLGPMSAFLSLGMGFIGLYLVGYVELTEESFYDPARLLFYGIPGTLIVLGLVSLNDVLRFPAFTLLIGDASYSLYLSHQFVLQASSLVLPKLGLPALVLLVLYIALALAVALLSYRLIEQPSSRWLSNVAKLRRNTAPKRVRV